MKGIKVNIDDIKADNNFEMAKLVVKIICITKNRYLSDTELQALSYFVINGYSKVSRENLIGIKLLKNKSAVSNLVYTFRKYGLLVRTPFGEDLAEDFKIPVNDIDCIKVEMLIKK